MPCSGKAVGFAPREIRKGLPHSREAFPERGCPEGIQGRRCKVPLRTTERRDWKKQESEKKIELI
jgi:hypothetical protein